MKKDTSWGKVSKWYDTLIEDKDWSFQKDLILPNLVRLMNIKKGESILDIACGQGFFTREFIKLGANASGADISTELIQIAREKTEESNIFSVADAEDLSFAKDHEFDKATIITGLQNIGNLQKVISEAYRVLKNEGKLYIVLNHPSFRVPQKSFWFFDEDRGVQYRAVEQYLSELMVKIKMHPGNENSVETISFHRPLQSYFKALNKVGFVVARLEEWSSPKKSQDGPKKKAEDKSRKEIPLFMFIEAKKC